MAKTFIPFLFFSITCILQSLGQSTWQIGIENGNYTYGFSTLQTFDKGYIVGGVTHHSSLEPFNAYVVKFDSLGMWTWKNSYGGSISTLWCNSIAETIDSGYVITGFIGDTSHLDLLLLKLNSNGDTIWQKNYDFGSDVEGKNIEQTDDGGFIISADQSLGTWQNQSLIIKTDNNGNISWIKSFTCGQANHGSDVHQTSDSGFIYAGSISTPAGYDTSVYLTKLNASGNIVWSKSYVIGSPTLYSYPHLIETSDRGFIIAGMESSGAALVKTDSLGNVLWSKSYGGQDAVSIKQLPDGGYVFCGSYSISCWGVRTDSSGNVVWSMEYKDAGQNTGCHNIGLTSDAGLIITGEYETAGLGGEGLYFIKTGLDGESHCIENALMTNSTSITTLASPLIITSSNASPQIHSIPIPIISGGAYGICYFNKIDSANTNQKPELTVFPNPTTNNLSISGSIPKIKTVSILNFLGENVLAVSLPPDSYRDAYRLLPIALDVSSLPPGIYFLQATTDDGIATAKFIKSEK